MIWVAIIAYLLIALVTTVAFMTIDIFNGMSPDNDDMMLDVYSGLMWPLTLPILLLIGLCEGLKKIAIWLAKKLSEVLQNGND